jgi:Tol biopolymer transport system component
MLTGRQHKVSVAISGRRLALVGAIALGLASPLAHAQGYQRPAAVERMSVSSGGAQGNGDSGWGPPFAGGVNAGLLWAVPANHPTVSMTPDGRYVAFQSVASNLVPNDLDGHVDVFVRDRRTGRTLWASSPSSGTSNAAQLAVAASGSTNCGALFPAISANGRYVAFTSCYPYLDGKPAAFGDVFVHDLKTGTTLRASATTTGAPADGPAVGASISASGRFVAFTSSATNLVANSCPGDATAGALCTSALFGRTQVYVRDMTTGRTTLVSVSAGGTVADGSSYNAAISPDGRYVAFTSNADNLSGNDHNECLTAAPSCPDVYLKNLQTGAVQLISVGLNGTTQPGINQTGSALGTDWFLSQQAISENDRYVVFESDTGGYVPADGDPANIYGSGYNGIYVRDIATQRTQRVSVDSTGATLSLGASLGYGVDPSGRYVVFDAVVACPGVKYGQPTAYGLDIGEHDVVTGTTTFVGLQNDKDRQNACTDLYDSYYPAVTRDGAFVTFASSGGNLVTGDTNGKWDIFGQNVGPALGTGQLGRGAVVTVAGDPQFARSGVLTRFVQPGASGASTLAGAQLRAATLAYRPQRGDVFARLQVVGMPPAVLADPTLTYGLDLAAGGARYEVRVAKSGAAPASIRLFQRVGGSWLKVASLRGGYGTTGQEIVFAIPLRDVGLETGGELSGMRAFTAVGTYLTDASDVLDQIQLSR